MTGGSGESAGYRLHFDESTTRNFARTFGDLALDRPDQVVTAENPGARENPPALQRVFNAAVATTRTLESYADPNRAPVTVMDEGAGSLVYLTESSELVLVDAAEDEDAYGEYLKKVLGAGVGMTP
ncbi:hypothetical protein [Georgenia sunbinii]|uniref:hypothetical protein n=1 Tax=Georgenia sunbinii TaxID=3117728 RepID=UPI002F26C5FF